MGKWREDGDRLTDRELSIWNAGFWGGVLCMAGLVGLMELVVYWIFW